MNLNMPLRGPLFLIFCFTLGLLLFLQGPDVSSVKAFGITPTPTETAPPPEDTATPTPPPAPPEDTPTPTPKPTKDKDDDDDNAPPPPTATFTPEAISQQVPAPTEEPPDLLPQTGLPGLPPGTAVLALSVFLIGIMFSAAWRSPKK